MSFLRLMPAELRAAETLVLPDSRKRLTRFFGVAHSGIIPPELDFDWGDLDRYTAPTGWEGLRLTARQLTDEIPLPGKDSHPVLQLIYEQIDETEETPVGARTTQQTEDGGETLVDTWVQFTTGTYEPQIVGTSTAMGDAAAFLQKEESVDNGTVRNITRTYVSGGIIATGEEVKNNGALSIVSITSVKYVPTTPAGYTLIGLPVQNPNGLPTFTYTYAKGTGQIDLDLQTKNNGALQMATVRYLTVPGVTAQPTTDPLSGGTILGVDRSEQDGYMLWTVSWAKGSGESGRTTEYRYNGELTLVTIRYLSAPTVAVQPTTDPLAGGVIISTGKEEQDGYRLWSVTWAKGVGQIDLTTEKRNNEALTIATIRHLTAPGVSAQPTSDPLSGGVIISTGKAEQDGYILWTVGWAKGVGEISRSTEYRLSNDAGVTGMTLVTIKALCAPGAANPITPPGGYMVVEEQVDEDSGYRIWTGQYAFGVGTVTSTVEYRNNGKLVLYSILAISAAPDAPAATIGGTVVLVHAQVKREWRMEGVLVYDYAWAEGIGIIQSTIQTKDDGLREQTYVSLGAKSTPSGVVTRDESEEIEGVTRYTVSCMQSASGGDPTSGSFTFERYVPFTYPGRLKRYSETNGGQTFVDVFKSPPVQTEVLATVTISYQTSSSLGSLPFTRWQPLEGATIRAQWVSNGPEASNMVESWRDYRSVDESELVVTGSIIAPNDSIFGRLIYGGTDARVKVTGGPPDPVATWTLDAHLDYAFSSAAGTRYFRKTTIHAVVATQGALPV